MPQIIEYDKTLIPKDIQLAWVYEADLAQEWLNRVPPNILKVGEKRTREYAASRKALSQVSGYDKFEDLEIINHHHLKIAPSIKVSLSHTRGLAAACASHSFSSIGIDVEFAQRAFNPEIKKFFLRPDDLALDLLQLWSIKEAAFKAIDPLGLRADQKKVLVLKDLVVCAQHIELEGHTVAQWNCQTHDGLITSLAWRI